MSSRYLARNAPEEFRDTSTWASIDIDTLTPIEKQRIENLRDAVIDYLAGLPLKPWLKKLKISNAQFLRAFNRCLVWDVYTGTIKGWAGLLDGVVRMPYTRSQSTSGDAPKGLTGALQKCFDDIEGLKDRLTATLLKRPRYYPHEVRVSKQSVHKQFINECKAHGLTDFDWPFNTGTEGRRSIDRFVDKALEAHYVEGTRTQEGDAIASKLDTGTGHTSLLTAMMPYDYFEMDGHKIHMVGAVGIPDANGLIEIVPIQRLQLLLLGDCKSTAIAGYSAVVRRECNANDMLDASYTVITPWKPRELCMQSMNYHPGGGLPSGVIPELASCGPCAIKIDNALINLADVVIHRVAARFGCALNWGPVRKWCRRPIIERINLALEDYGFERMVSSTGSNATDRRKKNPGKAAVDHFIHIDLLLDMIDLAIAWYNSHESEGLYGKSPLRVLQHYVQTPSTGFLLPKLPTLQAFQADLNMSLDWGKVCGSKQEAQRPYTKFKRSRYTGTLLSGRPDLIGHRIVRHIDRRNIQTIKAFTTKGELLGTLDAAHPWNCPHSLEFRMQSNRLVAQGKVRAQHDQDMVTATNQYLHEQALADAKKKNGAISKAGTMLAREHQMGNGGTPSRPGVVAPIPITQEIPAPPPRHSYLAPRIKH